MSETRRWVKIKEFKVADSEGKVYVIERHDEHIDTVFMSGEFRPSVGRRRLQLSDGTLIYRIDDDTFRIFGSEKTLKKIEI